MRITHYGDYYVDGELADRTTIHGSGTIDVQVSAETGQVVAVWFRCLTLPFRVSAVYGAGQVQRPITITAVEYADDPPSAPGEAGGRLGEAVTPSRPSGGTVGRWFRRAAQRTRQTP